MGGESPRPASTLPGAVFLSYASQDAEAAQRICEALRAAGIEVWFDQSELRGGDAWDRQIRKQIHDCALFIPLISQHSQERLEGYFRLEWKLAVDRSHRMAAERSFIVPVVVDSTRERDALVPDSFRDVQWTQLPGGEASPPFVARVAALLGAPTSGATANRPAPALASSPPTQPRNRRNLGVVLGLATLGIVVGSGWFALQHFGLHRHAEAGLSAQSQPAVTEKSIAVLPFVDLSEKHDQEYLADGVAEEILNLLVKIPGLRVIGRTSSFALKGKQSDLPSIGRALAVTYLVEGSVRRFNEYVRVTAQLVYAPDGSHRWSDTFEGTATDMLRLQQDIAVRIARALDLEVAVKPSTRSAITSPEAYDFYLRGLHALRESTSDTAAAAREYFQRALAVDPQFVPPAVGIAEVDAGLCTDGIQPNESCPRAHASVDAALGLDPNNADAYSIKAEVLTVFDWDWAGAAAAISKAANLGGGTWHNYAAARLACAIGDTARARQLYQEIIATSPFDSEAMFDLGSFVELSSGHFELAESWIRRGLQISPKYTAGMYSLGVTQLMQGKLDDALASMKAENIDQGQLLGLALVYHAMGRKADSDAALNAMQRNDSYFPADFATAFAFQGDSNRAMSYLETAYETHDPYVWAIKGDPLLKRLKGDPRFKAFLRKMNLPE